MQITCPSCGVKHRTEDHPSAFEINCVCGYAILVPDEAALSREMAAPPSPPPGPIAAEMSASGAMDEALPIAVSHDSPHMPPPLDLTPPDQLPEGMIYDPFELNQAAASLENASTELPSHSNDSPPTDFGEGLSANDVSEWTGVSNDSSPEPQPATGQALVNRVQSASMGRLLGASYELDCRGLAREALQEISRRCTKLLKSRPWLETEIRNRRIDLDTFPETSALKNVPEILAMEIYLACFELGGSCGARRAD